ncbi:MAG TPA: hypothetical protein VN253_29750 [Kofleriaceae bacterium]|nr:hypothetical protein [Kofleriaceae bacterium]
MRCLVISLLLSAACSGDSGTTTPDAPPYDTGRCLITGNYGDLGTKTGTTSQGPATSTIVLDPGPPRDSLFIKLNAGKGVFAGGLSTGTFSISGVDADFSNCGLCTNLIADIVAGSGPTKFYFADSGSVTLTATNPPAGMLSNVHLNEVMPSGTVVPGGCQGTISALMFSTN